LEFYTNIFAEPIVGNAISATPIIYAKSLIQLPSMVSNGIMRVHKVLSGEIFLYPELMTAIGTVLPYSKINFSVNMELMTANGIMELPTLYSGDKFVLAESIVVSTKMLCDGAIPMKDIYKKYISGYTTKIKRQVLTPAKLANKNYGSGNNF